MESKLTVPTLNRPTLLVLLICSLAAGFAQNIHYVKSSTMTQCPGEPCRTLAEYAQQQEHYFTDNTKMFFLRGDHALQTDIAIMNITGFMFLGDSTTLPEITSRIVCTKPASVIFDKATNLQIKFVSFLSCGKDIRVTIPQNAVSLLQLVYGGKLGNLSASVIVCASNVTFSYTNFVNSSGTALVALASMVTCNHSCIFFRNRGGGILSNRSILSLVGKQYSTQKVLFNQIQKYMLPDGSNGFMENSAINDGGGILSFFSPLKFRGMNLFIKNVAMRYGGGVRPVSSVVDVDGNITFVENLAHVWGGGVSVLDCQVNICGFATFRNNIGTLFGGALVAVRSKVNIGLCTSVDNTILTIQVCFTNNSARYGGAIDLYDSTFTIESDTTFLNNRAELRGGALNIANGTIFLHANTSIFLENNSAQRGGAVYVRDEGQKGLSYCLPVLNACFFQPTDDHNFDNSNIRLTFENNSASVAGADLYGGFVDNCSIPALSSQYSDSGRVFDLLTAIVGKQNSTIHISSNPIHICPCYSKQPACGKALSTICNSEGSTCIRYVQELEVYPGEMFSVDVVAYGQRGGLTPATVRTDFHTRDLGPEFEKSEARLGTFDNIQDIRPSCTKLNYTIFSNNSLEVLKLFPDGPCSKFEYPFSMMILVRVRHSCPYGFSLLESEGLCVCAKRLQKYTKNCDITHQTIHRTMRDRFWIGLANDTGLIIHPHCPLFYCTSLSVNFTLNQTDMQCTNNRAGLLCGQCTDGFSLVLGSSSCKVCSNKNLGLLLVFASAGIGLVLLLFLTKLTVAEGTINGLIFYANIVGANQSVFFSNPSTYSKILQVFIAWLNLDFGIEVCFYDGMDAYSRTWLQFVFPLYIWVMVGFLILVSHYSFRVSKWLGNNPVAVLATLFLLSYTKLLQTIIVTLSFTVLEYPHGNRAVWVYDGNVPFLRGKHAYLFIAGMAILLFLFLPYTLLLLLGQWLQAFSNWKCLKWASSNKVKIFLDAYSAPYKDKHRYWTGLLLVVRFTLLLTVASNAFGDPNVNLVAVTISVLLLESLAWLAGGIYKKWFLNALEASFILNLGIIAAGVNATGVNHDALMQTFLTVVFLTFIGILAYHVYFQIGKERIKNWKTFLTLRYRLQQIRLRTRNRENRTTINIPTSSTVQLRESFLEEN